MGCPTRRNAVRRRLRAAGAVALVVIVSVAGCGGTPGADTHDSAVETAVAVVTAELDDLDAWAGPATGPAAVRGKRIAFIAADMSNGGITAVRDGVAEAVATIGWHLQVFDGGASPDTRAAQLAAAIAGGADGLVLGGFDASEQRDLLAQAAAAGIPVVGWHAGSIAGAGSGNGLFTNVTTDPVEVATVAADFVIAESGGTAGVAIFYDPQYRIAVTKAERMRDVIAACKGCAVLGYSTVPLATARNDLPPVLDQLRTKYGDRLTYLLAINGNYFEASRSNLIANRVDGAAPPYAVAAGDGDAAEFQRIRDRDYQRASVAEPLYLQGWQLVDELNRAFAGKPASGYIAKPGLITTATVPAGQVFDPDSGYRDRYVEIWTRWP